MSVTELRTKFQLIEDGGKKKKVLEKQTSLVEERRAVFGHKEKNVVIEKKNDGTIQELATNFEGKKKKPALARGASLNIEITSYSDKFSTTSSDTESYTGNKSISSIRSNFEAKKVHEKKETVIQEDPEEPTPNLSSRRFAYMSQAQKSVEGDKSVDKNKKEIKSMFEKDEYKEVDEDGNTIQKDVKFRISSFEPKRSSIIEKMKKSPRDNDDIKKRLSGIYGNKIVQSKQESQVKETFHNEQGHSSSGISSDSSSSSTKPSSSGMQKKKLPSSLLSQIKTHKIDDDASSTSSSSSDESDFEELSTYDIEDTKATERHDSDVSGELENGNVGAKIIDQECGEELQDASESSSDDESVQDYTKEEFKDILSKKLMGGKK